VNRAWLLLCSVLILLGCTQKECETSENCPNGEVCNTEGQCIVVACTSSLDCNMEEFCSADTGQCTTGCQNDRDCLPTDVCDPESSRCVATGCRATALDCDVGEFCNALTGQCVNAGGNYCKGCESDLDCGSANNFCIRIGSGFDQTYCGVDCSGGQECPRGYECLRVRTVGDVTVAYQCVAPCWMPGYSQN
jgi:hypothetical protein